MPLTITPLAGKFAAEIRGVDLRLPVSDADLAEIQQTFDDYGIVVLPEQAIDNGQQLAFTKRLGPLEGSVRHGMDDSGLPEEFVYIGNVDRNGDLYPVDDIRSQPGTEQWHSDSSFKPVPAYASLLHARTVPPEGGDTEFADLRGAWDALPESMQQRAEGQIVIHDVIKSRGKFGDRNTGQDQRDFLPPVRQVLVRKHPRNGRKAIYVGAHASHIEGWPEEESRGFLDDLIEFATRPEFIYRHRWHAGDLVMWDNTRAMHRRRPWDAARHARVLIRTTVAGDGPTV